jgi:PAS domain S-box-containing protein
MSYVTEPVTDRKYAYVVDDLRFGRRGFAQLMEALPVGVFILDQAGVAVYANAAAETLLGRGIADGDEADNLAEAYAAYVAGSEELYPTEKMPIVRALAGERSMIDDMEVDRNGTRVALEVTATPIFDDSGALTFAVAVFQDITQRRRAQAELLRLNEDLERNVAERTTELVRTIAALEQEIRARRSFEDELLQAKAAAEQASRAKSMFLMSVSHELRTPLNHVIGFNELIAERIEDGRTRGLAETAGRSARDLLDRINDLIELARVEAGAADVMTTVFDFDALFEETRQTAAAQGGPLLRVDAESIGPMCADPETVRRILLELMRSCADDGSEEATLSVRHDRTGKVPCAVLSIASRRGANRLRALNHLFGETESPEATRFQQKEIDFRLAVSRAHARGMGGDISAIVEEGRDILRVVLPTGVIGDWGFDP